MGGRHMPNHTPGRKSTRQQPDNKYAFWRPHCCLEATHPPTTNQFDLPGHWKCPLGWGCGVGGSYMANHTPRREVGWGLRWLGCIRRELRPRTCRSLGVYTGSPTIQWRHLFCGCPRGGQTQSRTFKIFQANGSKKGPESKRNRGCLWRTARSCCLYAP